MKVCGRREFKPLEAWESRRFSEHHLLHSHVGTLSPCAHPVSLTAGSPLRAWLRHCPLLPHLHVGPETRFLGLSSPRPLSCLSPCLCVTLPRFPKVTNPVCPIVPQWIPA